MDIIQKIVAKYGGSYKEEAKKSSIYTSGKYTFHPQKGIFEIEGSKISINIQAVGGAARVTEPYRIILYLNKQFNGKLEIYPISFLKKILQCIYSTHTHSSTAIRKHYSFKGNSILIQQLIENPSFYDLIKKETVYITLNKNHPTKIILRPAYGIDDMEQFDRFIRLLKLIELNIYSTFN